MQRTIIRLEPEDIIDRILKQNKLYFDAGAPFLRTETHYQRLSQEDAEQVIINFLSEREMITTPHAVIWETLKRMSRLPRLQLHLEKSRPTIEFLVNTSNYVFDASDGRPSKREGQVFTNCCDFNYIPPCSRKKAETFERFIETSVGKQNRTCLLRSMGFALSNLTSAKKAICFYGEGNTGKSTLLDVISELVGPYAVSSVPFEKIGDEHSRCSFIGKHVNISREANRAVLRNEAAFKSLTSCERITGRLLYHNEQEFTPTVKLLVASNAPLEFSHVDEALLDRLVVIFFRSSLQKDKLDRALKSKLLDERDSIGSMALDALHDLIEDRFNFRMAADAEKYLATQRIALNSTAEFLNDCCELSEGSVVPTSTLYTEYQRFCDTNSIDAVGRNSFYREILWTWRDLDRKKAEVDGSYVHCFVGLKMK